MNRAMQLFPGVVFLWLVGSLAAPASAFTVNPDGTVTDPATGLMWDRCSWGQTWDGADACTGSAGLHHWEAALGIAVTANAANHLGHSDWRLPNRTELESLVDLPAWPQPAIDMAAFPDTPGNWFWSSTVYTPNPALAWNVNFGVGSSGAGFQSSGIHVRLVRSGQSFDALAEYTVTASAGANGTLQCDTPVYAGQTSDCTATPAPGFRTVQISGCGGTATGPGVDSYTTGPVSADCTVTASFEPVIAGSCGGANGVATLTAPAAELCGAGTASAVVSGVTSFTWSCGGAGGGASASCSAPRQYAVSASAGPNGMLVCDTPVTAGETSDCTATPDHGFGTLGISGCAGTASGPGVDSYTTGEILEACTVEASFVINTYQVTPSAGPGGSLDPAEAQTVTHGEWVSFTVLVQRGFLLESVEGCGGELEGDLFTTGAIVEDCEVMAQFQACEPMLQDFLGVTVPEGLDCLYEQILDNKAQGIDNFCTNTAPLFQDLSPGVNLTLEAFCADTPAIISDARLKEDIVPVGFAENGLPLYSFRYAGGRTMYEGVLAQDVLAHDPQAVRELTGGYLAVDYARLGLELRAVGVH